MNRHYPVSGMVLSTRLLLGAMLSMSFLVFVAPYGVKATVVPQNYYRMGENDPGAVPGVVGTTRDGAGSINLSNSGGPFYSANVATEAASKVGSNLSIDFFSGGPYLFSSSVLSTVTDNFGLEAWVRTTSSSGTHCIAYNGNAGTNGWGIMQVGNTFQGRFGATYFGSATITANTWYHVAIVRSSGTATLYVNGVASGTTTTAPAIAIGKFAVAASPPSFVETFGGRVDEVRFFTFSAGQFSTNNLLLNNLPGPVVSTVGAFSGVYCTNEILYGAASSANSAATVSFEYGKTTSYGTTVSATNLSANSMNVPVTVTLTNLTAGTLYHYRITATNSGGIANGTDQTFTTRKDLWQVHAYYRMGETAGTNYTNVPNGTTSTNFFDSVGGNHLSVATSATDGTVVNAPVYTNSVATAATNDVGSSRALDFIQGNSYGVGGMFYAGAQNFCLEAWVKPGTLSGGQFIVFNGSSGYGWGLYQQDNAFQGVLFNNNIASFPGEQFGFGQAALGTWTHLALVNDNGTTTLYVNGVAAGTAGHALAIPSGGFLIGKGPSFGSRFTGAIDEVRLSEFNTGQFSITNLLIKSILPGVSAPTASSVNAMSAVLGGTVTDQGGPSVVERGVVYSVNSVNSNPTIGGTGVTKVSMSGTTGVYSGTVTGLVQGTTYVFRPYATNAAGIQYGSTLIFTTLFSTFTPVVYYRFGEIDPGAVDNASTTNTLDSAGTNNLALTGIVTYSTNSMAGQDSSFSLDFGAGTGYGSRASLNTQLTNNFGFEAMVKPTSNTGSHWILYNGDTGSGWGVLQADGTYRAIFCGVGQMDGGVVVTNQWTHVAVVRDNGTSTLYVNRVAVASMTNNPNTPNGSFVVGAYPGNVAFDRWAGNMDEVRVFGFPPGQFNSNSMLLRDPEITVEQPAGTILVSGNARDFGTIQYGTSTNISFTIRNTGNTNLTGIATTIDGANATEFSILTNPATSLTTNASTTFTVAFIPASLGTKTATLHIASNDRDENPFNIALTGLGIAPKISVEQPAGTTVANNGQVNFGNVAVRKNQTLLFTIRNLGNTNLLLTGSPQVAISGASEFTLTQPASSIGASNSSTFQVTFTPITNGIKNATLSIANNDLDENPYVINITGTGLISPETVVFVGTNITAGNELTNNFSTNIFAGTTVGTNVAQIFTITNAGTADLNNLAVTIAGTNSSEFTASALGATSLAPGAWTTFTITFAPTNHGERIAVARITSNDTDESPFSIALSGMGMSAEIELEQPIGTALTNGATVDFGSVAGGASAARVFLIQNLGNTNLVLTGDPQIALGGPQASDFTVIPFWEGSNNAINILVTNSGFETPQYGSGGFLYAPVDGVWTFGAAAGIAHTGSPWFVNPSPEGNQGAFLQRNVDAVISQSLNFPLAGIYTVSWYMVRRGSGFPANDVDVAMDGTVLTNVSNTAQPDDTWRKFSVLYNCATPGVHTLSFTGTRPDSDNSSVIDDVQVIALTNSFQVTFSATTAGIRNATLTIPNNDPHQNPYVINLIATALSNPEIAIFRGTNLAASDECVNNMTTNVFATTTGGSSVSQIFTITNTGTANLDGLAVTVSGVNSGDFTVDSLAATTLAAHASTTFTVTFSPLALGSRSAVVSVANNDGDENPFNISVSGLGIASKIDVQQPPGVSRPNGSLVDFGTVAGGATNVLVFGIQNLGTTNLILTGNPQVAVGGIHASDFLVTQPAAAAGDSPITPDSGFETPALSPGAYVYAPGGAPWTFGSSAGLARNGSPWFINPAPEGVQAAYLQGNSGASISQSVNFPAAGNYKILWQMVRRGGGLLGDDVSLLVDGVLLGSVPGSEQPDDTWRTFSFDYGCEASGNHTLTFIGTHPDINYCSAIDDVRILGNWFFVTFNPTGPGIRTATLSIPNNDPGQNPFFINVQGGALTNSEIGVFIGTNLIANNELTNNFATNAFPATMSGNNAVQIFTITNTGTADLSLALSVTGTNSGDFTAGGLGTTTLAPHNSTTFTITFSPTTYGSLSAVVSIANNDSDENPFNIAVNGFGGTPDIDIQQPLGTSVTNHSQVDFGTIAGGTSRTLTFIIQNNGNTNLDLTGNPQVAVDGPNATDFIVTPPSASITNMIAVSNAGFEIPVLSPSSFQYAPGGASWSFSSLAGMARAGSPWFVNPPPQSSQAAYLKMNSSIAQTLNFSRTGSYTITWSMVRRGSGFPANDVNITMDGNLIGTVSSSAQPDDTWRTFSATYSCTTPGDHTLTFAGTRVDVDNASCIDDVQIQGDVPLTGFTVTFNPTAAGVRTATLSIPNNDPDENPFVIDIIGTALANPEIGVFRGADVNAGSELTNNLTTNVFTATSVGDNSGAQTFTITNSGTADLSLALSVAGENSGDFVVVGPGATNLPPRTSTTFTVTFSPTLFGSRSAMISITSNDGHESPFSFVLSGLGVAPDIDVQQPIGTSLTNGSPVDFGTIEGGTSKTLTFAIQNLGNTNLVLTGNPQVAISGTDASDFTVRQLIITPDLSVTISNSDFETPVIGAGEWVNGPSAAGWVFGSLAGVARNGSPWFVSPAPQGSQAAFLQKNTGATMSQTLNFPATGTYYVVWSMVRRSSAYPANDVGITMDEASIGYVGNAEQPDDTWRTFSVPYNCTVAGDHTLAFVGMRGSIDVASAIDNVRVVATTILEITFTPTAAGVRSAIVSIPNNDPNKNPYLINVTGTGLSNPEIGVFIGTNTVVANELTNNVGTNVFGTTAVGASTTQTFTITNTGTTNLTGLAVAAAGSNGSDFTPGLPGATTLAPGASTTFTVTFSPFGGGERKAVIRISSNDSDENPFSINVQATALAAPKIVVEQPSGTVLTNGGTKDFGSVKYGFGTNLVFALRDAGSTSLLLTGTPAVVISGSNAADFAVTAQPASPVWGSGSAVVVANSGFETPTFSANGFQYAPGGASWSFGGRAGIARNGSPWFVNSAPQGLQAAFVQMNEAGSFMSQTVVFPAPGLYGITFSMVRRSEAYPGNDIDVKIDSVTLGTISSTSQPDDTWRVFSVFYTCTNAGSHTLSFVGTRPGDCGTAIDDVKILGSTTFQVSFTPSGGGVRTANLSIANNDGTQNPYILTLTGTGIYPEAVLLNPSLSLSGTRAFQFVFTNANNFGYSVLSTTNLSTPASNWTVIGVATNIGGGLYQFTDPSAVSSNRYYRLRFP